MVPGAWLKRSSEAEAPWVTDGSSGEGVIFQKVAVRQSPGVPRQEGGQASWAHVPCLRAWSHSCGSERTDMLRAAGWLAHRSASSPWLSRMPEHSAV